MRGILAGFLFLILTGCSIFNQNIPIEDRIKSVETTLQGIEDTVPELVLSGDIDQADADKLIAHIDKAQKVFTDAKVLADLGMPQDPVEQIDLAITVLRAARDEVPDGAVGARHHLLDRRV